MLAVFALAACQAAPAPVAPTEVMAEAPAEAEISVVEDPALGKILVGAKGMTLYMFTKDEANKSNCAGDCLVKWPPLLTMGKPVLGDGVDASLVGSAALADGTKIVTYNGMPLYYWVNDKAAGDVTGQKVGDVWFVVSPDGKPVGFTMAPAVAEAEISVATDPTLGKILVGNNGMTLYMFTKDEANKSNCDSDCLAKWPPLLTQGKPVLGDGVDAALVGSAALADGTMIVTYNGMPLYYWVNDKAAGDATGQKVGDVWFVVSPDGKPVGMMDANANDNANSNANTNSNSNGNSNGNGDD